MALLKKNPEDPFAAPAISNGIRPIGKTHVFHKVKFARLHHSPHRGTRNSWLHMVNMELASVQALKLLRGSSSCCMSMIPACARGRKTA